MTWLRCLLRGHRRIVRWRDDDGRSVMCLVCRAVRWTGRPGHYIERLYR